MGPEEKHVYEIDLSQGDLYIQLISDDVGFIAQQMEKWCKVFIDPSYKPIVIPPSTFSKPASPQPEPAAPELVPATAEPQADTPSVQASATLPGGTSPMEQALLMQVQLLQQQVAALTIQTLQAQQPQAPLPQAPAPMVQPVAPVEALPQERPTTDFQPAFAPPPAEPEPVEAPQDNFSTEIFDTSPVESFATPAKEEAEDIFGGFNAAPAQPAVDLPSFEQPVNKSPIPVENSPEPLLYGSGESPFAQAAEANFTPFQQPVENFAAESGFSAAAPPQAAGTNNDSGDLDLLLDSLMSDLEEKPASGISDEMFSQMGFTTTTATSTLEKPTEPVAQEAPTLPEAFAIEEPAAPPVPDTVVFETQLSLETTSLEITTSFETTTSPPPAAEFELDALEKELSAQIVAPTEPAALMPETGNAAEEELEKELADLFTASPGASATPSPALPEKEYEAPEVTYDFGIPPPPPSNDPTLKKLSLESIQANSIPVDEFESPFPDMADEEIEVPHTKVTEQYSSKNIPKGGSSQFDYEDASSAADDGHIESLHELCEMAPNATSGADFLMLAAYFLTQYKSSEKYSLKDLNAQLVRSGLTPVNHGILEAVVAQGHIELVPDMTGTAQAAEYTLTSSGLAYAGSLIQS